MLMSRVQAIGKLNLFLLVALSLYYLETCFLFVKPADLVLLSLGAERLLNHSSALGDGFISLGWTFVLLGFCVTRLGLAISLDPAGFCSSFFTNNIQPPSHPQLFIFDF